jgi:hypothetical protein
MQINNEYVWIWGWQIHFEYNNHKYTWSLEWSGNKRKEQIFLANDETRFFSWDKQNKDEFIQELDKLLT